MPEELPVHISREELHALEVPGSFETSGSFDVRLINHGESLHAHLHLDDPLSEVAAIDAGNHYVEGDSERYVRVTVNEDALGEEPVIGKLKVASGYGATTRWVDVKLRDADDSANTVEVGESLAEPQPVEPESEPLIDSPAIPVLVLGIVAMLVAAAAAVLIQDPLVIVGALIVLAGVLVGLYFLLRDR